MKKPLAMILLLLFLIGLTTALAETWICQHCGKECGSNFCALCGKKKPEEKVTCPGCDVVYSRELGYTFCQNCGMALGYANLSNTMAGDIVTFGQYDQDGDAGNGAEDIEWIVLANEVITV